MRPLVYSQSFSRYQELEHAPALTASCAKGYGHMPMTIDESGDYLRQLTPLEFERLMGFPDGWTNIPGSTKGHRYKALGNAFVPAVCGWVLDGIAEQEQ